MNAPDRWPFAVRPLTPKLGAEIGSLPLSDEMSDATFDASLE